MLELGLEPGLSTLEPGLLRLFLSELWLPCRGQRAWGSEGVEEVDEGLQCPVMLPWSTDFCLGGTLFSGRSTEPQHKVLPSHSLT